MEKGWRKRHDAVKDKIMETHRRGVCNKNGESVRSNGDYIAKPRYLGTSVVQTMCNKCHTWYVKSEGHECPEIENVRLSRYMFSWFF